MGYPRIRNFICHQTAIANFGAMADVAEVGQVLSIGDGVARVYGLMPCAPAKWSNFRAAPKVWRSTSKPTMSASLYSATTATIREGDMVKRTGAIVEVPVGKGLLGRVVDALGNPSTARVL